VQGKGENPEGGGGCSIAPLGRSHKGGGEGVVVETHDDFPGVEISIAGGVVEMVRGLTTVTFFFFLFLLFFLISLIHCFYRGKMHNCAHLTVLGTRVLGRNVSHVDQNLQLQSFPLCPS